MLLVVLFLFVALWNVATVEAGQRYELSQRASEIDTAAPRASRVKDLFSQTQRLGSLLI